MAAPHGVLETSWSIMIAQPGSITMRKSGTIAILIVLVAGAAAAQELNVIEHSGLECIRAGQMPVLQVNVSQPGEVRVYFRTVGATDWCYVVGTNLGLLSNAILPQFDSGTEIEYFFVLLKGRQIVARSPQVYRAKASERCDNIVARHSITLAMECSPNSANSIPAALGAGYALRNARIDESPFTTGQ